MIRRLGAIAGALLALLTAACSENPPTQPPPTPPIERWTGAAADVRYRWSAEPGIDLLTGPAVIVRAYIESVALADLMFDDAYVYPGFDRAVPPDGPEYVGPWPDLVYPPKTRRVGTEYEHILRIERTGRDVVAVLCDYFYAAANEEDGGKVTIPRYVDMGTSVRRVFMTAPAGEPTVPSPPQKGPLPAPVDDVFGDWRITNVELGLHPSDWPTYPADLATCMANPPDAAQRERSLIVGEHPRSDFPTLPPSPGWPTVTS